MVWQEEIVKQFGGHVFQVEDDPDTPDFFSVFAYQMGCGVEVAGKIGERCVAEAIALSLSSLTAIGSSGFQVRDWSAPRASSNSPDVS